MLRQLLNLIYKNKKFVKFSICGFISAIIDIGVLVLLVEFFNIYVIIANTISFIFAVINSFLLNKYWTFRDNSKKNVNQFIKFLFISIVGLILNYIFILLLINLNVWYIIAKVIVIIIVAFWNFFANNFWTFNNQQKSI